MIKCKKENQVTIGRNRFLLFWSDRSITIEDAENEGITVTPTQIKNAYDELVQRGLIKPPLDVKGIDKLKKAPS